MSDIFRHPMLHEPILFPRAVIAVIAGALSVFGLDVTIVDTAAPGTVAERLPERNENVATEIGIDGRFGGEELGDRGSLLERLARVS